MPYNPSKFGASKLWNWFVHSVYSVDLYLQYLKLRFYRWSRISTYTSDAIGFIFSESIVSSFQAILKLVFNNKTLVADINISDLINQMTDIQKLNRTIMKLSKLNEPLPYVPYWMLEMIRFASSQKAKIMMEEFSREVNRYDEKTRWWILDGNSCSCIKQSSSRCERYVH